VKLKLLVYESPTMGRVEVEFDRIDGRSWAVPVAQSDWTVAAAHVAHLTATGARGVALVCHGMGLCWWLIEPVVVMWPRDPRAETIAKYALMDGEEWGRTMRAARGAKGAAA